MPPRFTAQVFFEACFLTCHRQATRQQCEEYRGAKVCVFFSAGLMSRASRLGDMKVKSPAAGWANADVDLGIDGRVSINCSRAASGQLGQDVGRQGDDVLVEVLGV